MGSEDQNLVSVREFTKILSHGKKFDTLSFQTFGWASFDIEKLHYNERMIYCGYQK